MKSTFIFLFLLFVSELSAADQWEQKANFGGIGRHRGTAFSIGNKGYMGFGHINSVVNIALADFWEYDPATDTWTQKADFGGGNRYHNLVFGVGGKGYSGVGRDESNTYSDFWEYDPATNVWTQLNDYPGGALLGPLAFIIDDVAYCGLGTGSNTTFYRYNQSSDTWTTLGNFPGPTRSTGVAFSIDGKGYVGTGSGAFGTGNDFWEYKPSTDQWFQRANVPGLPRQGATGFALNGRGYIFCGNDWNENFKDVWEFNPGSNTWKQIDNFPGTARRFMHSFVIHDKGYCGTGTNGVNFNDFWRFDPQGTPEGQFLREYVQVNVFPNPSVEHINFELPANISEKYSDITLSITETSGKLIHQALLSENSYRFNRDQLRNGVYFYQISASEELIKSGKFLFQ